MPIDWKQELNPDHTVILCMEMQKGVVSKEGSIRELADAVDKSGIVNNGQRLLTEARHKSVNVIHCTAAFREDRRGTTVRMPLVAVMLKNPKHMLEGIPAVEVIPQWFDETDLECRRYHGVSPFSGTGLDTTLRSMNIKTVLATGVSLNLGVTSMCIEAANLGYRVIVVSDAVAGFPDDYCKAIMQNTISLVAEPMTVNDIVAAWT